MYSGVDPEFFVCARGLLIVGWRVPIYYFYQIFQKTTAQTRENSWSMAGLPLVLAFLNIRQRTIIIHLNCTKTLLKKWTLFSLFSILCGVLKFRVAWRFDNKILGTQKIMCSLYLWMQTFSSVGDNPWQKVWDQQGIVKTKRDSKQRAIGLSWQRNYGFRSISFISSFFQIRKHEVS